MAVMYCELCDRPVEARRHIGAWTYIFGFLSVGLSTLAIPFYRKRCPICSSKALRTISLDDMARSGLHLRKSQLQERLSLALDELDTTSLELDRVREERDFYEGLSGGGRTPEEG